LLFVCVLLHELGHSITSIALGYPVRDITLLPIGGVARMEAIPEDPAEEILITAAGPAVNFLIALVLGGLMLAGVAEAGYILPTSAKIVSNLFWLNLMLGLFNLLLPAFPMDGGRVLRALLSFFLSRVNATRVASAIGQLLAALMVLGGIFLSPWLLLIGIFVWLGARAEARMVVLNERLSGLRAGDVAVRGVRLLPDSALVRDAARCAQESFQQDFPVMRDGDLVGILDRTTMARALKRPGPFSRVGEVAVAPVLCGPNDSLAEVYRRLAGRGVQAAILMDGTGGPVGLVTVEQMQKILALGGEGAVPGVVATTTAGDQPGNEGMEAAPSSGARAARRAGWSIR
jgi:stage IV sporulation protein FB